MIKYICNEFTKTIKLYTVCSIQNIYWENIFTTIHNICMTITIVYIFM